MTFPVILLLLLWVIHPPAWGEDQIVIRAFPYEEDFESVQPPDLPPGWTTSANRSEAGDFRTDVLGGRNRLTVWHPGIEQHAKTPVFDFTGYRPLSLQFWERRTGTFQTLVEISASLDGGNTFPVLIGQTFHEGEGTQERVFTFELPSTLVNEPSVVFKWRVVPHDVGGSTANARFDDIHISAVRQYKHDLQVIGLEVFPLLPTTLDSLHTIVTIYNAGLEPAAHFSIGIGLPNETPLTEVFVTDLVAPGDSLQIQLSTAPLPQAIHLLEAIVAYDLNEGTQTSLSGRVHVTQPISSYPWNELFNYSDDVLPVQWRASYRNGTPDASLTSSIVHQGDRAIIMSNARREQYIILPPFQTSDGILEEIVFYERRTGTFDATMFIEISTNRGKTFDIHKALVHSGEVDYVRRTVTLDYVPSDQPVLYVRIRLAGDGTGTTATIRLDSFSATRRPSHNLLLTAVDVIPPLPTTNDHGNLYITISNRGMEPATDFTIALFILSKEHQVEEYVRTIVEPDDTVSIGISFPPLSSGKHPILARLYYPLNEEPVQEFATEVHVSESIRSYPWVETFPYAAEILPPHWRTSETNGTPDASLTSSVVYRGSRAIIMSNATKEQHLILPPFDTSEGMLRDLIFFERRTGTFDATMHVDVSTDRGKHFHEYVQFIHTGEITYVERRVPLDEWLSASDILYIRFRFTGDGAGTTGTIRFDAFEVTARLNHDVAVTAIELDPPLPMPGEGIFATIEVKNVGLLTADRFDVSLYRYEYQTTEPEYIGTSHVRKELHPSEITFVTFKMENIPPGYSLLRAEVYYPPDTNTENNSLEQEVFVRFPRKTLLINEILYHTREGQPEFVEIYNPSDIPIDIRHWVIRDRETPGGHINRYVLSDTSLFVEAGSFIVLAANSSIFDWFGLDGSEAHVVLANRTALGLSSLGDIVMLLDPSGSVIDSVAYAPSWHHPDVYETRGRSLERISPDVESQNPMNWSTSADPRGGTPGRHNSIYTETPVVSARIQVSPNPFSPNADGFEDYTMISYSLPQQTAMVRLRIFDALGRHIRTLLHNDPSGPEGRVIWDGRNDRGQSVRLGIYVILLEAYDDTRGGVTQLKTTVVVADRL